MYEQGDEDMSRFLRTARFFCVFCVCYLAVTGLAAYTDRQYDTYIASRRMADNDIYREFGMIAPAAGDPASLAAPVATPQFPPQYIETYAPIDMPPPPVLTQPARWYRPTNI